MSISRKEAERIIAEGGSISLGGKADPYGDGLVVTDLSQIPDDFEFGDEVTLDNPSHPVNVKRAAQNAERERLALGETADPNLDADYQDYLRWKSTQARAKAAGMDDNPVLNFQGVNTEDLDKDDDDPPSDPPVTPGGGQVDVTV